MTTDKRIATIGENGKVTLPTLDKTTGERGVAEFDMGTLCRLGYGKMHMDDIVVEVESREVGRNE
jgi:hypothetical protein